MTFVKNNWRNDMKNTCKVMLVMTALMAVSFMSTGCFTPMVWKENARRVALKKAIERGNADEIAAVRSGRVKETEIEVTKMEVFNERKGTLIGAGLLDTGLLIGAGLAVDEVTDGGSSGGNGTPSSSIGSPQGDATIINIDGDGNTVSTGDSRPSEGIVLSDTPITAP